MRVTPPDVQSVSTLGGQSRRMGVSEEGLGTILSILSNMYSDGGLAVVREYASNARDSHMVAGNDGPVLITSPNHLNPIFVVQDFGTGLSRQEVEEVYAVYGVSTKRDTDSQIGAFGIGAKSAFTVGTQFVVTAIKDGWQTVALFALNDAGDPTFNILSHTETDEPNGVKVEIGVRDVGEVQRAIERLFPTWPAGSVLVDGVEPSSVWAELSKLSDNLHIGWRDRNTGQKPWTIVMGGIPYEIPNAVTSSLPYREQQIIQNVARSEVRVFAIVPIGSVDITPSREDLRVTPKTTETIRILAEEFLQHLGSWISEQIEQADTIGAALIAYRNLKHRIGRMADDTFRNITWHGHMLPVSVVQFRNVTWFGLRSRGYYGAKTASRSTGVDLHPTGFLERYLFITDVPANRIRSVQLAAKPYLSSQDKTGHGYVVALTEPAHTYTQDWFSLADSAYATMTYDQFIKDWKPAPTPAQRGEVRYDLHGSDQTATAGELVKAGKVYYLTHAESKWVRVRNNPLLTEVLGTSPLVILSATQKWDVLQRRVPAAKSLTDAIRDYSRNLLDNLNKQDTEILFANAFVNSADSTLLRFLIDHKGEITNKLVLSVISQYEASYTTYNASMDRRSILRSAAEQVSTSGLVTNRPEFRPRLEDLSKVATGLPLLYAYLRTYRGDRSQLGDQHVIQYINSTNL